MMRRLTWMVTTIIAFTSPLALAHTGRVRHTKTRLKQIDKRISNLHATLLKEKQQRNHLQSDLKKIELRSATVHRKLKQTHRKLYAIKHQVTKLQQQNQQQQLRWQHSSATLSKQLENLYILDRQPYLKLILNQQDPNKLQRLANYYHYFSVKQLKLIHKLQANVRALKQNQTALLNRSHALRQVEQQQYHEQQHQRQLQQRRQTIIKHISHEIYNKKSELLQLIHNKNQLQKLLNKLQQSRYVSAVNFAHLRRHLRWPARGQVNKRFGVAILNSQLHYDSVFIDAASGDLVRAVANGQVIFAKWMAGYGLLVIIDHGDGYMTLYGHNGSLSIQRGEIVHRGEVIASVGDSGGFKQSGLYFAIRHNGTPLNPARWCR